MTGYWEAQIYEVNERLDSYNPSRPPVVGVTLETSVSPIGSPPLPLPRTGQKYWLVDDETFRRLVWKDAE